MPTRLDSLSIKKLKWHPLLQLCSLKVFLKESPNQTLTHQFTLMVSKTPFQSLHLYKVRTWNWTMQWVSLHFLDYLIQKFLFRRWDNIFLVENINRNICNITCWGRQAEPIQIVFNSIFDQCARYFYLGAVPYSEAIN